MGYTTDFEGAFIFSRPLTDAQHAFLIQFAETRRMKRYAHKIKEKSTNYHKAVGLPLGIDGGYYVNGAGMCGQDDTPDVVDHNEPPQGQPGLWCQWVPIDGALVWDGNEKFYNYVEWLQYIIDNFLKPWGVTLNGEVEWKGEDSGDMGKIIVKNNEITVKNGRVVYD